MTLPSASNSESQARTGAIVVLYVKRRQPQFADVVSLADFQLFKLQRKFQFQIVCAGEADIHNLTETRFEVRRPDNGQGAFPLKHIVCLEQKEWNAADVIAVEVREEDAADVVALDPKLVHRNDRCRTTVDQNVEIAPDQMEAGIESSARTEGIAAPDELQLHERSPGTCRFDADVVCGRLSICCRLADESVTQVTLPDVLIACQSLPK